MENFVDVIKFLRNAMHLGLCAHQDLQPSSTSSHDAAKPKEQGSDFIKLADLLTVTVSLR
jgi:hypothetical protein